MYLQYKPELAVSFTVLAFSVLYSGGQHVLHGAHEERRARVGALETYQHPSFLVSREGRFWGSRDRAAPYRQDVREHFDQASARSAVREGERRIDQLGLSSDQGVCWWLGVMAYCWLNLRWKGYAAVLCCSITLSAVVRSAVADPSGLVVGSTLFLWELIMVGTSLSIVK